MSATNWATCPQCEQQAKLKHEAAVKKWKASYGKVSAEKYDSSRPDDTPASVEETLREDYELGIDGNLMFAMHYRARCEQCGLEYRKEISEQVNP